MCWLASEEAGMEMLAFLTVNQVAESLQVRPETVRLWLQETKLHGVKLPGGDWRIRPEDLEEMLKRPRAGVA